MKAKPITTCFPLILTILALAACGESMQQAAAPEYTAGPEPSFVSQADAGEAVYAKNCGTCHGAELQGTALGPMLSGAAFLATMAGSLQLTSSTLLRLTCHQEEMRE